MLCLTLGITRPSAAQAGGTLAYVVADTVTDTTHLVLHDLATGVRQTLLTHRSARGSNPVPAVVAPDGRLAYPALRDEETDYNLFVWDNGVLIDLGDGSQPAWSADGRLAFISDRTGHYALYVWDGQTLTDITSDAEIVWRHYHPQPMWHSDGRLAFQTGLALYVWTGQKLVTIAEGFLVNGIAWRADGCLTFGERGNAVKRSKLHVWCNGALTTTEIADIGNLHGDMAWSSDGRLALKVTRSNSGNYDPAVYLWDGQTFTFIAEADYAESFVWSEDGTLAFHIRNENGLELHVWQDGVQTALGTGHAPAWSADGRLAFDCGFWQICVWDGQTTTEVAAGTMPQWVQQATHNR